MEAKIPLSTMPGLVGMTVGSRCVGPEPPVPSCAFHTFPEQSSVPLNPLSKQDPFVQIRR